MVNQPSLFSKIDIPFLIKEIGSKPEFYNTIHLAGQELKQAKEQTGLQDARVLQIFRKGGKLTPVEAWEAYCRDFPAPPLTSIRRSITVLTGKGQLVKTSEMREGKYGKNNFVWSLAQ